MAFWSLGSLLVGLRTCFEQVKQQAGFELEPFGQSELVSLADRWVCGTHCSNFHFSCVREAPCKDKPVCTSPGIQTANAAGYHGEFCSSGP